AVTPAMTTITVPSSAKTNASGTQRSVQSVSASAIRAIGPACWTCRVAPEALFEREPSRRIGSNDQVPDVSVELAPPVWRASRNDDDVARRDPAAHATVDARAPDGGAGRGFLLIGQCAARDQRRRALEHVVHLARGRFVQDGV